jgi:hypothetical protein
MNIIACYQPRPEVFFAALFYLYLLAPEGISEKRMSLQEEETLMTRLFLLCFLLSVGRWDERTKETAPAMWWVYFCMIPDLRLNIFFPFRRKMFCPNAPSFDAVGKLALRALNNNLDLSKEEWEDWLIYLMNIVKDSSHQKDRDRATYSVLLTIAPSRGYPKWSWEANMVTERIADNPRRASWPYAWSRAAKLLDLLRKDEKAAVPPPRSKSASPNLYHGTQLPAPLKASSTGTRSQPPPSPIPKSDPRWIPATPTQVTPYPNNYMRLDPVQSSGHVGQHFYNQQPNWSNNALDHLRAAYNQIYFPSSL